jgi:uncharacterized protein DUF6541
VSWWDAAPALLVAALLLVAPGALVAWAAGVRGVLRVALAPALSVGVVGVAAVGAGLVGVRWSWVVVAAGTLVTALGVLAVRLLAARVLMRKRPDPEPGDGAASWVAASVGVLAGGAALVVGFARGVGSVTRWPQTFDAVFHLSAAWHVLSGGDGSSLTLGTLTAPGASRGFYPAAWHDLVALVAGTAGVPVVVASNVLAAGVLGLAWPLGSVALARVALGRRPLPLAAAGALAAGVTASPVVLASYGTLWPNALGTALLPAALALVVVVLRADDGAPVERPPAGLLLLVAGAGLALAHPNTLVSLVVLGVVAAVVVSWPRGGRARWAALAAVPVTVWLVAWSPLFAATRGTSWPARQSMAQAAGEWLMLSPQRLPIPLAVAGLTVLGCVVAWRRARLRWLLAVHVTGGALFALVAGSDSWVARLASGPWYDDAFRLAALAGVSAVPLAAVAVDALAERVRVLAPGASARVSGAVLLAAVVVLTGGLSWSATRTVTGWWYRSSSILDPGASALLERLPQVVPTGGVVAGSPFDGAAEAGALGDREPLFPHLTGRWDPDRALVGADLREAAARPEVCAAVRRLHVTHVLTGPSRFWTGDARRAQYAGLDVAGSPGFEPVDRAGSSILWRVTACG